MAGQPIGFVEAALRNLVRAADALPVAYFVGVTSMALTKRFQRLGDLVAGTMVIVVERRGAAMPLVLVPAADPSELRDLPDVVTLDADERRAIELFLRRRGTLGPAREAELARMIAPALAARFSVPHERPGASAGAALRPRRERSDAATAPPSSRASLFDSQVRPAREGARRDSAHAHRAGVQRTPPSASWSELEQLVRKAEQRGLVAVGPVDLARLSPLYRDLCNDLARARSRSLQRRNLTAYLSTRSTASAHAVFYGVHARSLTHTNAPFDVAPDAFPRAFRRHNGAMACSRRSCSSRRSWAACSPRCTSRRSAYKVAPESMLKPLAEAYARGFTEGRETGEGAFMAGFYVNNNVGIALR